MISPCLPELLFKHHQLVDVRGYLTCKVKWDEVELVLTRFLRSLRTICPTPERLSLTLCRLLPSESKEVPIGSDVHDIFNQGRCGANFLANDISSQDFQLFGARIYYDNGP